ncbi:MAG: RICIN domain-containing protein [Bacteroidaceae bacterium]|nr:RICIN domain-containing protein [Bacteroidaceae bacterium]
MKKFSFLALLLALIGIVLPQVGLAQNVMPQRGDKVSTADGIYAVSGDNLIANPSFDEGFTGWLAGNNQELDEANFEAVSEGGADGGAFLRALGSAGSGSASSIKKGWAVEVGKTYLFSMWANRPSSGMSSNTQYSRIYASDSETATTTQIGSVNFTGDTWVQTQITFTAEKPFLVVNLGWMNHTAIDAFFLGELSPTSELATAALEATIADGKYQLDNTEEGDARGQYSADVRAALQTAISAAEGVLASATTQTEINAANDALKAAITTYKASANAPFKVGTKYNIVHSSGYLMTTTGGTVKVVSEDADDAGQVFTFVPAPADAAATGYNLQADDGTFVHRQGSWDTKADADYDLTQANAIFQVVDQGTYIQLKNMGSGSVLGTDSNNDGSTVYSNKNGTDSKFRWTLKEFIPKDQRDDEYNFRQLLAKAQKTLAEISASTIGTDLFMTSRTAYDTFAAAIATAESVTTGYKAATETLQAALDTFTANKQVKPDPAKNYIITQNAGGNRIAYTEDQSLVTVRTPNAEATQQFTFAQVAATGNFSLKNVGAGLFVAKSGSSNWDTNWAEDDSDLLAQWLIERHSDGTYTLQNASGKGYLGSDATTDGALLYCDKAASAANSRWIIEEYTATAALAKAIANAKQLAATTSVGSAYYEVPQSAMDALNAAIAAAEAALATITTFEQGAAEAEKLNEAIATFTDSFNPIQPFDEGVTYTIQHYGGALLTATESGNASITAQAEEGATDAQLVTFEAVEGRNLTYYLKSVALETYFARSGDYNTVWQADKNEAAQVEIVQLDGRWLGLQFVATGLHAGTDNTASGQLVYSDKAGRGNTLAYWTIEPYVTVQLDRAAFNAAVDAGNALLAQMKPGYLKGEYFPEDIAALRNAISNARAAANKAKDQQTLDALTAQLKADIEAARAKAHDRDLMNHSELAAAIQTAATATASAVAGDCNGQYPAEAIEAYKQALIAAEAVNNKPDDQLTQAELDAAAKALKEAAAAFNAQRVVINLNDLRAAITAAQKAMSDAESMRGDGPGKYPESAFTALTAAVTAAQTIVSENKVNQAAVDAQTAALTAALETFAASRVTNDYTALQALVDEATQLIADALAGKLEYYQEDLDELRASLEKNAAALESTDQDVIDRAVKLLRRDIALFRNLADGIAILDAEPLDIRIYDLNGRLMTTSRRHLTRGTYLMTVTDGDKTITRKFVVR